MAKELHFYPGDQILFYFDIDAKGNKTVIARSEAVGGPDTSFGTGRTSGGPTSPGRYIIDKQEAYRTDTWKFGEIPWGTPLLDKPAQNDVWYKLKNMKSWGSIKNDFGYTRTELKQEYFDLYTQSKIPTTWVFNPFGPVAIRWFKDLNGNGIFDPIKNGRDFEKLEGQMFHTTPVDEANTALSSPVNLEQSHGCIHLNPQFRDHFIAMGAFKKGTPLVVHLYTEHYATP